MCIKAIVSNQAKLNLIKFHEAFWFAKYKKLAIRKNDWSLWYRKTVQYQELNFL
jgi:hypothetical protein